MKRPNILLLYTDQQRWDAVGVNGNPHIKTPNLDRLARQGLNFDHYFIQNPVCMPSRISFLSGQYPSTLGITHMGVPVPQDTVTLPVLLQKSGYVTANIGKLHFLPHANRDHREPHPDYGFTHLQISDEPGCYEDAYRAWVRLKSPDQLDNVSVGLPPLTEIYNKAVGIRDSVVHPEERFPKEPIPFRGRSDVTQTAFVADQTMEFIERHKDQNWFCIAGFYSPHSPWVAPQEFIDLYDPATLPIPQYPEDVNKQRAKKDDFSDDTLRKAKQGYYAMVSEVDSHVGHILDKLDELGLAEDTLVVFTSDHGEWLGEHLRYGKSYPAFDPVSRVPFIVRWPNAIRTPGVTVSRIIEGVDFAPTVLESAGIQAPPRMQGHSLTPYFAGKETGKEEIALTEQNGWKNIRTPDYRYICWENGKELLFDLAKDSAEYHDVADDPAYATVLADMRKLLLQRVIGMERPLPRIWGY
ncbi:MAG: sulfatase [Paenibacillaceae bacterium]|nr:sulfatase [Paenibacillaceae bacterium]